MSINEHEFKRIYSCTTSKEAQDTLVTAHEGDTRVKVAKTQMLIKQYNTLVMTETESIDDFYIRLTDIVTKLHANGIAYDRKEIVYKILSSLPQKFDNKRYAIEEMDDQNLTPELLGRKLRTVEMELEFKKQLIQTYMKQSTFNLIFTSKLNKLECHFPEIGLDSDEDCNLVSLDNHIALMSKQFKKIVKFRNKIANRQGKPTYSNHSNNRPHEKRLDKHQTEYHNKPSTDLKNTECYICGKLGHIASDC